MTITVNGFDGNPIDQRSIMPADRFLEVILLLAFSGSYSTGGDVLDLTNGGGTLAAPNLLGLMGLTDGVADITTSPSGPALSQSAIGGYYTVVPPNGNAVIKLSDLANLKLKIFAAAGSELAAGVYPAAVLTDVVKLRILFRRGG
jgi:hypothetical protein